MPRLAHAPHDARPALHALAAALLAAALACNQAIAQQVRGSSLQEADPAPERPARGRQPFLNPGFLPARAPAQAPLAVPWHRQLARDRRYEMLLQDAASQLRRGNAALALRQLQVILEDEVDCFVRMGAQDGTPARGAAAVAEELIAQLADPQWIVYEQLYGPAARRLLLEALHAGSADRLAEVVRRYFYTSAGFEACCHLAAHAADHGHFEVALALWKRLHDSRAHHARLQPLHRAQMALCLLAAGQSASAATVLRQVRAALNVAGRQVAASDLLPQLRAAIERPGAMPSARQQNLGASQRPLAEDPLHPVAWSRSLAGPASAHIARVALAWEPHQVRNGLPVGTAQLPCVAEGRVYFRDYEALHAVELTTGRLLWSYACQSSLNAAIPERRAPPPEKERDPDPNGIMRLVVGNCPAAGGCSLASLATDGRLLYLVDRFAQEEPATASADRPAEAAHRSRTGATLPAQSNVLLALPLHADGGTPSARWQLGGPSLEDGSSSNPLTGHYFVGAPLIAGGRLYAASECNLQLYLSCICADSGRLHWSQPLCTTPMPVSTDAHRFSVACTPSLGEGLVICPTHVGLLVAVDAVTGRLRWGASVEDADPPGRGQLSPLPYQSRGRFGHAGFPSQVLITGGKVLYLPPHSERCWCLELPTGRVIWRVAREDLERATAIEYLAGELDGTVLLVGRRKLRGLRLATGQPRFQLRLPASPTGAGARLDDDFHLLLDNGQWLAVNMATGAYRQMGAPIALRLAGNLTAAGNLLISMSRTEISLLSPPAHFDEAPFGSPVPALASGPPPAGAGQILRAVHQVDDQSPGERMLAPSDDPGRTVSARVFLDPSATPPRTANGAIPSVHASEALTAARRLSWRRPPRTAQNERAALDWSLQLAEAGQSQQAETALLSLRAACTAETFADAGLLLADLWTRHGLHHQAALLLDGLPRGQRVISGNLDQPGNLALRDPQTAARLARLEPPAWDLLSARIEDFRAPELQLHETYNANGVHCLVTPRNCPFDLFDAGASAEALFTLVDRATGAVMPQRIKVPGRYFYPVATQAGQPAHAYIGNLLPLGGPGSAHAVSLLEQKLLWSTRLPGLEESRELVRVGPANPALCVLQHRQHLYAVDPLDGHLLWHRNDLEPTSGLMSTSNDPSQGIIGDEQIVVVFASNGTDYTLYDARDGAEAGRGRLEIVPRQPRRALGRHLLHFSACPEGRFVRVWDPLTGTFVLEEPSDEIAESSTLEGVAPGTRVFAMLRDHEAVVFLTLRGTLKCLGCRGGAILFEVPLPADQCERASFLRPFKDSERFYCNVQRAWPPGKGPAAPGYIVSDAVIPLVHCLGELHAIDAASGRIVWSRALGNRSIVQTPEFRLPVLLTLCRVRKGDQTFLEVEVLDARTGSTLARRDDLPADRLLQLRYERDPGLIELRGSKGGIRVTFAAATRPAL